MSFKETRALIIVHEIGSARSYPNQTGRTVCTTESSPTCSTVTVFERRVLSVETARVLLLVVVVPVGARVYTRWTLTFGVTRYAAHYAGVGPKPGQRRWRCTITTPREYTRKCIRENVVGLQRTTTGGNRKEKYKLFIHVSRAPSLKKTHKMTFCDELV